MSTKRKCDNRPIRAEDTMPEMQIHLKESAADWITQKSDYPPGSSSSGNHPIRTAKRRKNLKNEDSSESSGATSGALTFSLQGSQQEREKGTECV